MTLRTNLARLRWLIPADEYGRVPSRLIAWAAVWCITVSAVAFAGYERLYSTFMEYDDEGYVLLTLQEFAAGHSLYDEVYTPYGPAFFLIENGLHGLTGLPLTHDGQRLKTLLLWLLTSALSAGAVYRLTRSPLVAIVTFGAAFLQLEKLALEPGLPQEWCVLGLALALFATTFVGEKQALWRVFLLALATAVVGCIKPNLGIYLCLSITLALLLQCQPTRVVRGLTWLVLGLAAALPIILLRSHLGELTGWRLPAVVLAGLAGVVLFAWKSPKTSDSLEVASYLSSTGVLGMSVLLWCVCRGTPIASLAGGLLFQHGKFMERFYHDMPVPAWTPLWCLAAVGLGFAAWRGSTVAVRAGQVVAVGLALYVGLQHVLETTMPLEHGLVDRGGARLIMGLFAPLAWLVVLGGSDRRRGARLLLALVAVLQPLAIYPTPGTQLAIGALPLLVCLLVVLHDIAASPVFATDGFTPCVRVAIAGLAMLLGVSVVARGVTLGQERAGYVSLGLPGATRLRLPPAEAARWQWAVQKVRAHGDTFVGLHHGQCSIYLWAGLEPPTTFTAPMWSHLLNERQQREIVGALRQQPYSCVFYNRRSTSKYDPDAPLAQYLLANYEPAENREGMEVWRRK